MKIPNSLRGISGTVSKHSPAILTGLGIAGLVGTAVMASKATLKAHDILTEAKWSDPLYRIPNKVDAKRVIQLTWKTYLPTFIMGTMSIACILGGQRIGAKRTAALGALYSLSEATLKEYQEQVVEEIGEKKEKKIRSKVSEKRLEQVTLPDDSAAFATLDGNDLCFDELTGRYFYSCKAHIEKSVNEINHQLINDWMISLNDFYNTLGLPTVGLGDLVGWNTDYMVEVEYDSLVKDGRPVLVVKLVNMPKPKDIL